MASEETGDEAAGAEPGGGQRTCDCNDPDCRPADGRRPDRWKLPVTLAILCAAGAATAYSLTVKSDAADLVSAEVSQPTGGPTGTSAVGSAGPALCGLSADALAAFSDMSASSDAVVVLVPDADAGRTKAAAAALDAALTELKASGKDIAVYTADAQAGSSAPPAAAPSGPCVIVTTRGGGPSLVQGEITRDKLVRAFVTASRPSSTCSADCACK